MILAIPAYNCSIQIKRVLESLIPYQSYFDEIWVIDNLSIDSTKEESIAFKSKFSNLKVFVNDQNINLGGTHKSVFQYSKELSQSKLMILHGDDQASVNDMMKFFEFSKIHPSSTILGSRFMKGSHLIGYDKKRIVGNVVLNSLYSLFSQRKLSDLGSGLNLFNLEDLNAEEYLTFGNSLSFNYELILNLVERKREFHYVPITWRDEDQTSNARNWKIFRDGLYILLRWRFTSGKSDDVVDGKIYPSWTEL